MKITMKEYDGCFAFDMTAETMEDAALLTRYSTNVTNKVRSASSEARKDGVFSGYLVLAKRRRSSGRIVRAR